MIKLIPDEEVKRFEKVQWAPMVDFLFIIIIVFATVAITRTTLHDTDVSLVRLLSEKENVTAPARKSHHVINLSVSSAGKYRLISETSDILLDTAKALRSKLLEQQQQGILPQQHHQVKVLLHIDKKAPWQPIAEVIFAMREAGFAVNPVYQSPNQSTTPPLKGGACSEPGVDQPKSQEGLR